jgi:hypothetical protein
MGVQKGNYAAKQKIFAVRFIHLNSQVLMSTREETRITAANFLDEFLKFFYKFIKLPQLFKLFLLKIFAFY